MISCGDDDKKSQSYPDEDTVETADEAAGDEAVTDLDIIEEDGDIENADEATDEDTVDPCLDMECPDHSKCVADGEEAACVCNEGYHPTNSECISDTEITETGDFILTFKGPINATSDPATIVPGTGDAEFTYFGEEFTFTTLHVQDVVDFPFAAVADGGMVTTTWIDAVSMTPKFFAVNVPDNLEAGTDIDFVEKQIYALYGDLSYDGTSVSIKCIRSVSGDAKLDITELSSSQIEISAAGKLIDPVYAAELGYNLPEVCTD